MKIKRLIALSITAAALAGGAAFAQDTHFDGYTHNPIAMHNDQQSSFWNQKRDLKKEEQIRKKREQEEKKRIEFALILHRKNAERLQEMIHKAEIDGTSLYLEK